MKTKKKVNNIKSKIKIFSIILVVLGIASIGAILLRPSKATTTFQPLEVGLNFHSTWQDGLHTDADNYAMLDKMAEAGIKWVRIDMGWVNIEETGDVFGGAEDPSSTYVPGGSAPNNNWYVKRIDKAVNYANSKGIKVLGLWWTTPQWARASGPTSTDYRVRPADPNEYAESLEWAAKYWKGRIDDWQVWNEADPAQKFWGAPPNASAYGGTVEYANLLKASYPRAKIGNPSANVVMSGASSVDDAWLTELYVNGIKNKFDTMAVHPYQNPSNDSPLAGDGTKTWQFLHVPKFRDVMVANGDSDKPIWFTELGWSTHDNTIIPANESWNMGVTEQQQGDYAVQAIEYAKANWPYVENIMFYTDKNLNGGGTPSAKLHQDNFGFFRTDNSVKPAYTILKKYLATTNHAQADLNIDGKVNVQDLSILISKWATNSQPADINKDGIVNVQDLSILISGWTG